ADPLAFLAQEIGEVAGREAGRTTLSDIGQFAAQEEIVPRRDRQRPRLVAKVLEHRLHDAFGAPVQPSVEDLDVFDFGSREGARLVSSIVLLLQRNCHALRSVRRSRRDHERITPPIGSQIQSSALEVAPATLLKRAGAIQPSGTNAHSAVALTLSRKG